MPTKCLTCGETFVCACDRKAAHNHEELEQHSLQQLKAEIALLIPRIAQALAFETPCTEVSDIIIRLEQLSAV